MKTINNILLVALAAMLFLFPSCDNGDSDLDYGTGYVYLSSATLTGGLNNYCLVPSGWGVNTYNFKVSDNQLDIIIGVTRSGKIADAKGFSVSVNEEPLLAAEAVEKGDYENAFLLPSGSYSFPSTLSIAKGDNYGSFLVSVDTSVLKDAGNAGKNFMMSLSISNPTEYELAETNTSVVIVIDVDSINQFL